jgi:hypothetical protein
MSSYLSSNDDDLFDYEPDEEVKVESNVETPNASFDSSNELFKNIKNNLDSDLETVEGNIDSPKVKLTVSYHLAYAMFLSEINKDASSKSLHIVLDRLTNGDFTLIKMFYEVEMKISRRLIFLDISREAFKQSENKESFLDFLSKTIGVTFTEFHKATCYQSTWNITQHALNIDKAVYLTLSKKLGLPVEQSLFDENFKDDHPVTIDIFKRDVQNNAVDVLLQNNLLAEYTQLTGQSAIIAINNVE